jgi:hypothetical protein
MLNNLVTLAGEIPLVLSAGWGVWFFFGLLLSIWGRREQARLVVNAPRHRSGVRPPSAVRPPVSRPLKSVPLSSGNAFGELEALLEQPAGSHRTPGEPAVEGEPAPAAPAPQSLP